MGRALKVPSDVIVLAAGVGLFGVMVEHFRSSSGGRYRRLTQGECSWWDKPRLPVPEPGSVRWCPARSKSRGAGGTPPLIQRS